MFHMDQLTPDARVFFDNLPLYMQENIVMASVDLHTKEELESYVENMQKESR